MNKKMNRWVTERIKDGATINMESINRKDISLYNNIYLFIFYRRMFFWDNLYDVLCDFFMRIKDKIYNYSRRNK